MYMYDYIWYYSKSYHYEYIEYYIYNDDYYAISMSIIVIKFIVVLSYNRVDIMILVNVLLLILL